MILLLDTTTDYLGIGLWVPPQRGKMGKLYIKTLKSPANTNKKIISIIENFLKAKGYKPCLPAGRLKVINAIGLINGPGSFTGVRTGTIIANTFAYALKIPIYSINSLSANVGAGSPRPKNGAEIAPLQKTKETISLISAAKEEVYFAKFEKEKIKDKIEIINIRNLSKKIKKSSFIVGQIRDEQKEKIKIKYKEIKTKDRINNLLQMIIDKKIRPQKQIKPLYIKKPNITIRPVK